VIELDLRLFHFLNQVLVHPWLDVLMPIATHPATWAVALGLGAIYLAVRQGDRGRRTIVAVLLALALGDFVAAQLLKPAFHRLRPCHDSVEVRNPGRCGGRYGFPSNHATNAASVSAALGTFYPVTLVATVPLALLVGWSRIYLGVHYPADVVAGFLLGAMVGVLVAMIVLSLRRSRLPEC